MFRYVANLIYIIQYSFVPFQQSVNFICKCLHVILFSIILYYFYVNNWETVKIQIIYVTIWSRTHQ